MLRVSFSESFLCVHTLSSETQQRSFKIGNIPKCTRRMRRRKVCRKLVTVIAVLSIVIRFTHANEVLGDDTRWISSFYSFTQKDCRSVWTKREDEVFGFPSEVDDSTTSRKKAGVFGSLTLVNTTSLSRWSCPRNIGVTFFNPLPPASASFVLRSTENSSELLNKVLHVSEADRPIGFSINTTAAIQLKEGNI